MSIQRIDQSNWKSVIGAGIVVYVEKRTSDLPFRGRVIDECTHTHMYTVFGENIVRCIGEAIIELKTGIHKWGKR